MKTIVLTGMMGSGKSTVAKILKEKLNLKAIDIDSCIEKSEGSSISEIFKNNGEKYFRIIEGNTIKTVFKPENIILSLGGGAFENKDTREFLLKNSVVIYLETSADIIFERIKTDTSRPLLCDNMTIEKISEIMNLRKQNYQSATYTINTDNKTPTQIAQDIIGAIKND